MSAWLAFGWGMLLGVIVGMFYAAGVVRHRRQRVRPWVQCRLDENGLSCSGDGALQPGETFIVEANGTVHEVIVVNLTSSFTGHEWVAVERAPHERRHRIGPDDQCGTVDQ